MEISQEGIALIKRFEGCKLQAYKCSAGVPTIGFGSTRGVEMGMEISQERAEALVKEVADKGGTAFASKKTNTRLDSSSSTYNS